MPPRPPPGAPGMMPNTQSQLDMEINRIPPQMLMRVKVDLGIGEKDMVEMAIEDKVRALLVVLECFLRAVDRPTLQKAVVTQF